MSQQKSPKEPKLSMFGITKYFSSSNVVACNEVDFSIFPGEVHALVGENGAGKTTLMNILYGLVQADQGKTLIDSKDVEIENPFDAIKNGIGMVHQHFQLVPTFSVAENILLGVEKHRNGLLLKKEEIQTVKELSEKYHLDIDPTTKVNNLPIGMQQRVEILKALYRDIDILILDEPTAVLTPQEFRDLKTTLINFSQAGKSVIFISHKLPEVMLVADRITVMRKGSIVGTMRKTQTDENQIAKMMVGRNIKATKFRTNIGSNEVVLKADHLFVYGERSCTEISFQVKAGEIVGIAGVSGNGQVELVEGLTGMRPIEFGSLKINGQDITDSPIRERRDLGLVYIPEDRIKVGLYPNGTLADNLIVSTYNQQPISQKGIMQKEAIKELTTKIVESYKIVGTSGNSIKNLSGGNLQRVVIGRELDSKYKIIIADQPTRGLDIGSIEYVHQMLADARSSGAAILLISVELDEILSLSDRILVMYNGKILDELDRKSASKEELGKLMAGIPSA